jgi:CHAT domain-containing protein
LQSFATPVTLGVAVSPTIRHCVAPHWTEPRPIVDQLLADRRALLDYAIETIADLNDRLPPIDPQADPQASSQTSSQTSLPTVIGHRLWAEALLLRGEVAEAEGLTPAMADRVISQTEAGLIMAHRVGATDLSVQLLWQAGRMASRSGNPTTARPYYAQAIAELEQLRIDLGSLDTDWRYDFRDAIAPLYRDYLAFLLPAPEASLSGNYSGDSGLAVPSDPVDLKTAIGVLQQLQLAELDDFFGEACAVPQRFSIEDWEQASEEKYRRTALLATVVLDDRTEIIIAFPDPEAETSPQWLRYSNPLDQRQVKAELHILWEALRDPAPSSGHNLRRLTPKVYDRFFREAIAALEKSTSSTAIDTILFLPDGGFRSIPLGTFRPKDGDYLIQRYTIAVIPSFDLIATEAEGRSRSRLRTLAVGRTIFENDGANTTTNTTTIDTTTTNNTTTEDRSFRSFSRPQVLQNREDLSFPNLPGVKLEIVSIADLLPQSSYLLDTDFLSDTFAETIASRRYDIAHIATHGSFGALADQTFIVAQDGLISFDRLGQILRSNDPTRETDLDLVILSACQTAEGSDRAVLGMAGMGLRAGVRSTIGSLWNVSDFSTSLIMQAFYRHRLEGLGKAEALAAAQRDALNGDLDSPTVTGTAEPGTAKDFSSPYYWSPFVLVGDW